MKKFRGGLFAGAIFFLGFLVLPKTLWSEDQTSIVLPKDYSDLYCEPYLLDPSKRLYGVSLSTNAKILAQMSFRWKREFRWLTPDQQFVFDAQYNEQVQMRRRLYAQHPTGVFQIKNTPGIRKASQWVLDWVTDRLKEKNRSIKKMDSSLHPLAKAALGVQEDLVLTKEYPDGTHRVVGGFVAFPTGWSIESILGSNMADIHSHYESEPDRENLVHSINMLLSRLEVGKIIHTAGWFISGNPTLPQFEFRRPSFPENPGYLKKLSRSDYGKWVFLRIESQTVTKIPVLGFNLFTIHYYVYPIERLNPHSELRERLHRGLGERPSEYNLITHRRLLNYLKNPSKD